MRPIDADHLRQLLKERTQFVKEEGHPMWAGAFGVAMSFLNKCPTIDAVPVVRCKDCKHRVERGMCYMISGCPQLVGVGDNFWCAYGERKDGA